MFFFPPNIHDLNFIVNSKGMYLRICIKLQRFIWPNLGLLLLPFLCHLKVKTFFSLSYQKQAQDLKSFYKFNLKINISLFSRSSKNTHDGVSLETKCVKQVLKKIRKSALDWAIGMSHSISKAYTFPINNHLTLSCLFPIKNNIQPL